MSLVMIIGVFANLSVLPIFATEEGSSKVEKNSEYYRENYLEKSFGTAALKIATMTKMLENDKYIFYVQKESGEWCVENKVTGQHLFSNPYDVGGSGASEDTKMKLLSQVLISFSDSGVSKSYSSYKDCVMLDQVKVKNLKNGVRVEYSIGNEETRKLIPMQISAERFQTQILDKIPEGRAKSTFESFFQLKSLDDPTLTTAGKKQLQASYPIVEKFPIYVFLTDAGENEKIDRKSVV